jgi:hypothetical protein
MSDKCPQQASSVNLGLIAELIDQSSLGSPHARLARNEVDPSSVMALRDRAGMATSGWASLAESAVVLQELDKVPSLAGRHTKTYDRSGAGFICAVNNRQEIFRAQGTILDVPGRPAGTVWSVYLATDGKRRCEIRLIVDDPSAPGG